jgi:hypothetical protein
MGPSSTLSLRHFNSTRVRHCEVELIPKSGVCTLSCLSPTVPNPKLWTPTVSHKSLCCQSLSLASRARSPCVNALLVSDQVGKLLISSVGLKITTKRLSLGSLPVRHPHPKHVVSRQMRAESKHNNKLALGYRDSRDLLAGSLSSAPTGVLHQQQGEFSSCIFKCIAYWPAIGDNSHRISSKSVLLLVVLENVAQI